jgi:hypothetical protein
LAKDQFVRAMDDVRRQRRRNGAMSWALYDDVEQPNHLVETFKFATWAEHEREQQRRTAADATLHATARAHLIDGSTPSTVHYLGVRTAAERHLPRLRSSGQEAE